MGRAEHSSMLKMRILGPTTNLHASACQGQVQGHHRGHRRIYLDQVHMLVSWDIVGKAQIHWVRSDTMVDRGDCQVQGCYQHLEGPEMVWAHSSCWVVECEGLGGAYVGLVWLMTEDS